MQQAKISFGDGEFHMIAPGSHVVCAVTGRRIPIEELRYWSVPLQEAYASPQAVLARLEALAKGAKRG